MELPRVELGLGEIQTKNSSLQLQIKILNLHDFREPYCTCIPFSLCLLSNILYFGLDNKESIFILVWIIKKAFSFWLSHDYCACSKDKVQENWQHFHNNFILNYSEFSMLLFYFDLWWFETLVCYKNILRFYCDGVEDNKTIHFPIISLTIIFFF